MNKVNMHWKSITALLGALSVAVMLQGQTTVRGVVTAAATGEALIGANIQVKSTAIGTVTDVDGSYELQVPDANVTLVFSYIGFQTQEVPLNGRTTLNLALETDAGLLQEVVVVGYGVQRKSDLTGAVATVGGKDLSRLPTASVQQALQGKVPGVQVVTSSGRPGDGAVVRVRGIGTLNNANPLYVVDGVILGNVDINAIISPNDIETLTVLKDASAAAIYGARGANGVILITTKKGTPGARSSISFSSYYGTQGIIKTIPLTNAKEYAMLANEVVRNETNNPNAPVPFPDPEALGEGTDWQKEVYRNAPIQNYNLALSGGNEFVTYMISGDLFEQQGIILGSSFQRITVRANSEYKVKKYLKIGHNFSFSRIEDNGAPDVVGNAYRADPTVVGFKDGVYGNTSTRSSVANPLGQLAFENDIRAFNNLLVGALYAELDFLKHFKFRSSFGLSLARNGAQTFVPAFEVTPQQMRMVNSLSLSKFESNNWLWENTLTYSKDWRNVRLNVLGGITAQDEYREGISASAQELPFDDRPLRFLRLAEFDKREVSDFARSWSMLSYLFRVNTTLFEKYLLTASVRADGSSRFGRNNRFGYFPSFALGWRITEEEFMKNQTIFSNLKLRAGWGETGNDQIDEYASRAVIQSNLFAVFGTNEVIVPGATLTALSNPDLKWESIAQTNIGFEMGFLKNRLSAEIDYYNRTATDILWRVPIPGVAGLASAPPINAAQMRNTGFDFLFTWQDQPQRSFGYSVTFTGSTNKNEVLRLSGGEEEFRAGGLGFGGELGSITRAGLPVGSFYGYQTDGVIQTQEQLNALNARARELTGNPNAFWRSASTRPGDLLFRDLNGDGIIDGRDRTVLGNPNPDVFFGMNFSVNFKGVELTADFTGQAGNQIINSKKMARFNTPNFERSYLNRWTGPGTSNSEPRVTNSGDNYLLTPRFIEDGSFILLRNVQLSYQLPENVLKRLYLTNLRVYVAGSNLKYWTEYSGYTPEIVNQVPFESGIDRAPYPIARVFTFGLNASF